MSSTETATFGTGCFWCTEAIFKELEGVISVMPGYSGGQTANPTYKEVCRGETGHAECTQVVYEPSKISYDELLEVFFKVHDPTSLNRQGADVGTQYRSAIFYHSPAQKQAAEAKIAELTAAQLFDRPIVTEIAPAGPFYKAEDYHQGYFRANPDQPYCQYVVSP